MLIHWKLPSFLKISREIRNEGRCGYVHCTCQIVSDRSIPIVPNFSLQSFSRKFRNFVSYRLACFGKNGEKVFFKIWTFFDCCTFKLINDSVLESLTPNCPVVVE
ncbi:hypothetical protein T11_9964 [Trichinella zimbabwensis]|uniref:Uncharacterized protein n=1 Tax=Trichinella zimbabwensis TaxID=268475 RepID=A0A0V1G9M5_9BILA|nr:hypothetical protein T11_9964 [Trichinella zimbabwensis]